MMRATVDAAATPQLIRDERAPDAAFAARYPRAEKYTGWPMLLVLRLRAPERA